LEESESDLVIRVTATGIIHTDIIHTATTGHIRTTATTAAARRIIGITGIDTIATIVITTIIPTKLM
jgi:hypothetical protein